MRRIESLTVLFSPLIQFVIERARADLWTWLVALFALLWNLAGRALRSRVDLQKHDHNVASRR